MKSLKEMIDAQVLESSVDAVYAVLDENEVIMGIFDTEDDAKHEIRRLGTNPVPLTIKKMKRSEIEG